MSFAKFGGCLLAAVIVAFAAGAAEDVQGDPYTLNVCAVSGEELGSMGEPIVMEVDGREVRLCCAGCRPRIEKDPAKYLSSVDEKMVADQMQWYPLETDVVTGEKLGDDTINMIYKNRLVRLNNQESVAKFNEDPGAYLAKVDEAVVEKQDADYPIDTCVISGQELGSMGEPIDLILANRLVKICCAGCSKGVHKEPVKAFEKLGKN